MRFLALNELEEWYAEHGVALDNRGEIRPGAALAYSARAVYAESGRSGREPELAAACAKALGDQGECLLWVRLWGVWPSSEDWPSYYAMRGACGERRSLEEAPGHLFAGSENDALVRFLTVVMENAWDADALAVDDEASVSASAFISHDGWIELSSSSIVSLS